MNQSRKRRSNNEESDNGAYLYAERILKKPRINFTNSISSSISTHRLSCDSIDSTTSTNRNTESLSADSSEGELSPVCYDVGHTSFATSVVDSSHSDADSGISTNYSDKAKRMMNDMGYRTGKGLGKSEQGIIDPIEASKQRGMRGLGFAVKGLEPRDNLEWDQSKDHTVVEEKVAWMEECLSSIPDLSILSSWVKEGAKKREITGEHHYCDQNVLTEVLSHKSIFDHLSEKELIKARSKCNPFESIGKLFFLNRAALKMANLDSICDFMYTSPMDENGHSLVLPDEVLYFADVCAAPGGFSEYVLWKRKSKSNGFCDAKGFGFTLKENDFKLHDFYAAPAEFFEPHYGVSGTEGDGDVYNPTYITNFKKFVLDNSMGRGVHFMMADGGFSVEGQENIQEILSKRIYLCQFLVALGIVRIGGHFVCKLFDVFTPFSVGLVYLMYLSFKHVSIHKPNSSRPANSERYIICKGKRECTDVYDYLFEVNMKLKSYTERSPKDLIHLVPHEILREDESFFNYIFNSNNDLGLRQVSALKKIHKFCQDPSLMEGRQTSLRRESLEHWGLPDQVRRAANRKNVEDKAKELLKHDDIRMFSKCPSVLTLKNFEEVRSLFDFRFVVLASPSNVARRDKAFFLGLGGKEVYKWNGTDSCQWEAFDTKMELPPDTLLYGELVTEYVGCPSDEDRATRRITSFHIIDGLILNGFDIRDYHLAERHSYLRKFSLAIDKPGRGDLAAIHCKTLHKLENINEVLHHSLFLQRMVPPNRSSKTFFCEQQGPGHKPSRYIIPTGIMLLKISREPWMMAFSKTNQRKYWFNTMTGKPTFETCKEAISSFCASYSNGFYYWFEPGIRIHETDPVDPNKLQLCQFLNK